MDIYNYIREILMFEQFILLWHEFRQTTDKIKLIRKSWEANKRHFSQYLFDLEHNRNRSEDVDLSSILTDTLDEVKKQLDKIENYLNEWQREHISISAKRMIGSYDELIRSKFFKEDFNDWRRAVLLQHEEPLDTTDQIQVSLVFLNKLYLFANC